MKPLLLKNLHVRRGRQMVLEGVDLDLESGQVVALLGRNGEGKSTLLLAALGLLPHRKGTVRIAGLDPRREGRAARERAVLIPDRPDVPGWMTPADLCTYLAPQYPLWDWSLSTRALEEMQVPRDKRFSQLSRGNATKALLATGLAAQPDILLLDEPFANLDPVAREELQRGLLLELAGEKTAVLMATHELESCARLSDRVVVLSRGRITRDLPTEEALVSLGGAMELGCLLRPQTQKGEAA